MFRSTSSLEVSHPFSYALHQHFTKPAQLLQTARSSRGQGAWRLPFSLCSQSGSPVSLFLRRRRIMVCKSSKHAFPTGYPLCQEEVPFAWELHLWHSPNHWVALPVCRGQPWSGLDFDTEMTKVDEVWGRVCWQLRSWISEHYLDLNWGGAASHNAQRDAGMKFRWVNILVGQIKYVVCFCC